MAIEMSSIEIIGNIIGGLLFYVLLGFIIYYIVRLGIRHERERQNKEVIKQNGKHKR